jgi:hypothetical protein
LSNHHHLQSVGVLVLTKKHKIELFGGTFSMFSWFTLPQKNKKKHRRKSFETTIEMCKKKS